jgi:pimeloyl-ACP methyl ester carboxylesterase
MKPYNIIAGLFLVLILNTMLLAAGGPAVNISSPLDGSGYIHLNGGDIFYQESGHGRTLLFLHGKYFDNNLWDKQFSYFARYNHVLRYDVRGYGKSRPSNHPYSCLDDLACLLKQKNAGKVVLIGMAEGAKLAVDYAIHHPGKLYGLVLINPQVSGLPVSQHYHQSIRADNHSVSETGCEELLSGYGTMRPECPELSSNNKAGAQEKHPAIKHLDSIKIPVLIIVGEKAPPDLHAHSGALEAGIESAHRIIIPKGEYALPLENSGRINALIHRFLKDISFLTLMLDQGIEKAISVFESLKAFNPDMICLSEQCFDHCGLRCLSLGKSKHAIRIYKLMANVYPHSWRARFGLAESYARMGNKRQANRFYKEAEMLQ